MKNSVLSSLLISSCALLSATIQARACGSGSLSIINPFLSSDTFQVSDLNSAGAFTGYFYGAQPAHAFLYQGGAVTDLGTLGGSISEGFAINSLGNVVGTSYTSGDAQFNAFLYSGGTLTNIGTLGGPFSSASFINDAGVITGDSLLAGASDTTAFLYTNGTMVSLGTLGGTYSSPFALNNLGQVVGQSTLTNGDIHGFVSAGSTVLDLGTLGGSYSSAFALNDAGTIAGESSIPSSDIHGFVYSAGTMKDLGTFGGVYSSAYLINTNGQVVGVSTTPGEAETHGFIYTGGVLVDLGTLGTTSVSPNAINNRAQVVGSVTAADGTSIAFLWQTNHILDLNTLLPTGSGWQLSNAMFINDAGRIVGTGSLNGVSQWFVLDLPNGNNPPVAVAEPDQKVDCQAQVTLDGSRSSDPDGDPLSYEWSSGGTVLGTNSVLTVSLPLGTNVVTLKVTDTCGASSDASATVIVADTTPPTGSCPAPVTASADANCQAAVPNLGSQVIASDNCTPAQALTITQSPAAGTLLGLGSHPITITVTDASGNSSACTVLFTVADTTPPVILSSPAAFTLSVNANCQAQVPNILPNVVASDSCTPTEQLVKTQAPAAGTSVGTGAFSILVTVTDAAGNSSTASVAFTVADTTPPTIVSGPSAIKLSADASCQAVVPNILGSILVTDNCTPTSQILLSQKPAAGTVLSHGVYSIVVTATDASGNSSTLTVPMEIDDTTPPTIVSGPAPVKLSADSNCQAVVPNILGAVVVSDNCTPTSQILLSQKPAAGTVLSHGIYSIVVTATDASGNSSTLTVPIEIDDTTPPTIVSAPGPITVSADDHCNGVVPNVLANVVASDNCTPASQLAMSQSPAAGTVLAEGQYTIVVSVTDASGNTATSNIPLAIIDTTPPTFQALTVSPSVLSPPNHQLAPVTVSASVSDNCDPAPVTKIVSITCSDVTAPGEIQITGSLTALLAATKSSSGGTRVYTITVQSTDASGNSSSCQVTVSVPKNGNGGGGNVVKH